MSAYLVSQINEREFAVWRHSAADTRLHPLAMCPTENAAAVVRDALEYHDDYKSFLVWARKVLGQVPLEGDTADVLVRLQQHVIDQQ